MYHPQIMRAVHVWVDQDKDGEGVDEQGGSHPVQLPPLYRTVPGYCTVWRMARRLCILCCCIWYLDTVALQYHINKYSHSHVCTVLYVYHHEIKKIFFIIYKISMIDLFHHQRKEKTNKKANKNKKPWQKKMIHEHDTYCTVRTVWMYESVSYYFLEV